MKEKMKKNRAREISVDGSMCTFDAINLKNNLQGKDQFSKKKHTNSKWL